MDELLPLVEFAADERRLAFPRGSFRRRVADGEIHRLRRGAYVAAPDWRAADGRTRHLVAIGAMQRASRRALVFSHESAAALWGIPLIGDWPDLPHVTAPSETGWRTDRVATWHVTDLGPGEVARVGGFLATSPERTAVDLASGRPLMAGVAALDHVLSDDAHRAEVRSRIETAVRRRRPFRGVRRVDAALGIATGLAESALESLSLTRFAELGLPRPEQQHVIPIDGVRYRVDFFWPELDLVGEADGRAKYDDPQVLWQEKQREDAIRTRVRHLVRWTWQDALSAPRLASKLAAVGLR